MNERIGGDASPWRAAKGRRPDHCQIARRGRCLLCAVASTISGVGALADHNGLCKIGQKRADFASIFSCFRAGRRRNCGTDRGPTCGSSRKSWLVARDGEEIRKANPGRRLPRAWDGRGPACRDRVEQEWGWRQGSYRRASTTARIRSPYFRTSSGPKTIASSRRMKRART